MKKISCSGSPDGKIPPVHDWDSKRIPADLPAGSTHGPLKGNTLAD